MKLVHLALGVAAFALAACGQSTEAPAPETTAPQSLMEQMQSQSAEQQLVTAFQALIAYQQTHPEAVPPCASVRGTESRGVIPPNVAPDSVYAPHIGSLVYSIQCGNLRSMERFDPTEHWLVVYAPTATEPTVENCADATGRDKCPRQLPIVEIAPTPTP